MKNCTLIKCSNFTRLLEDILAVNNDSFKINMMAPDDSLKMNVIAPVISQSYLHPRYPMEGVSRGPGFRMRKNDTNAILFSITSENNENGKEYAQVYFQDPINGALILPTEFEMKGDQLKIPIKAQSLFRKFKTKISKFQHIEGDPNFECQTYTEDYTYANCIGIFKLFKKLKYCNVVG